MTAATEYIAAGVEADARRPRETVRLVGAREQALTVGRGRLALIALAFALCFVALAVRLIDLTLLQGGDEPALAAGDARSAAEIERADIVDRNGVLLATNLKTASLYADTRIVPNPERAADQLVRVLPDLSRAAVLRKLQSGLSFVWLKRNLTPKEQYEVNRLGIPGLDFQMSQRRIYPHGPLAAHVLGYTDIDNVGIAGIEQFFDAELRDRGRRGEALRLSLDVAVQHALRDELQHAVKEFDALGAGGLVLDIHTGEVVALVSLPDFDPNHPGGSPDSTRFNRISLGVYEPGSVFKMFTVAMALNSGTVTLADGYDASHPLRVARYVIRDDHPKNRWLSVPEIFMYSSNIGSAKMALDVGTPRQQAFMEKLGLLRSPAMELPEIGAPLSPNPWREINTMTIAFGHGMAVSPLQLASGVAAMINGGILRQATLVRREAGPVAGDRVISPATSDIMRRLLRLVVSDGTGRKADVPGYLVGGKTGTAEKAEAGGYNRRALLSSFVAAFPMNAPRYLVYAMIDEPKGNKSTFGFATGGWTAAPAVGRVIARIAPILGVHPVDETAPAVVEAMSIAIDGRRPKLASY